MKNFKEEIEAMKAQIAALENNLMERSEEYEPCCDAQQCGCGCDESPVEVEDEGPEFDSAGFSEVDRLEDEDGGGMRHCGDDYYSDETSVENTVVFTREELIIFAAKLMERTVEACKSAVSDTEFEPDYCCELSLSYNNQIEVEIDNSAIRGAVCDEIDNTIELDNDSVEVEVDNILRDMLNEKQS